MIPARESAVLRAARNLVCAEAAALVALEHQIDDRLEVAARAILARRGKVFTAGVGTSGHVAQRMAHLLSVTGTPAVFLHPTEGLHGSLGAIQSGEVLISISKGGLSDELNEFTRRAKKLGATVVVLTGDAESPLGLLGDVTVELSSPVDGDPGGIVAMGSTLVSSAWGDALALCLMQMREYGWDAVLYSHPGGAVGKLAAAGVVPGD